MAELSESYSTPSLIQYYVRYFTTDSIQDVSSLGKKSGITK